MTEKKITPYDIEYRNNVDFRMKLDWNELQILPDETLVNEFVNLCKNFTKYNFYPELNNIELKQLLANYVNCVPENIQYFGGSDMIHEYVVKLYLDKDDKVLILKPTYDNFRVHCEAQNAEIIYFLCSKDYSFDAVALKESIKKTKPKLAYICNPNNPTGFTFSREIIEEIISENVNTMFLIDEAYFEFSVDSDSNIVDFVNKYDNIIISRTLSKAFGIANFRFGYIISSENNIKNISKIRNPKNISTLTQEMSCIVLRNLHILNKNILDVKSNKQFLIDELRQLTDLHLIYGGGNYLLIKFINKSVKDKLYEFLLDKRIYVRNFTEFPLDDCLRVSIGRHEQMTLFIAVIKEFLNTLEK